MTHNGIQYTLYLELQRLILRVEAGEFGLDDDIDAEAFRDALRAVGDLAE